MNRDQRILQPVSIPTASAIPATVTVAPPVPTGENVALLGIGRASARSENAHQAFDGDLNTLWGAEALPTQWLQVILDDSYVVDRIQMVVAQTPAGPTTHDVWLGNRSGTRTLYQQFIDVPTQDGTVLEVVIEPPRNITEVVIHTLHSPSWVAWREVRVFGSLPANSFEETGVPQMKLKRITSGLDLPVQITNAGDGSGRLFVVEQKGRIRIIEDGVVVDTPFLDLSEQVSCCGERGMFNVAFPPDYLLKQQFYVSYTDVGGHTIISRFKTAPDADRAEPESEEVLIKVEQPYEIHNGGRMVFGPQDGYLYIGSGDGGSFTDPLNSGQDPGTLRGKLLRIDAASEDKPYGIPLDNPFIQNDDYREEIWALGLRNPWGFAFDSETGDLFLPDVGNSKREEINFQPAGSHGGENYGWRIMEGSMCFDFYPQPCSSDGTVRPVLEYDRQHGCAIVGGAIYRGAKYTDLQGIFIFADFCTGRIWGLKRLDADAGGKWLSGLLLNASVPISGIGEDEQGNVYVTGYQDGFIAEITER